MSSRVYGWARSLRRDGLASVSERLFDTGHRLRHAGSGSTAAAHERNQREPVESGIAPMARQIAELTRQEEAKLVQRIFVAPGVNAPRTVLFADVERDNGCAHVCLRAGHALARLTGQSVCVVDADLRSPKLHRLSGAAVHEGLADAMANPAAACSSFARRLEPKNLWLLAAGSPSAPDALLTMDRIGSCLQELGARFDRILINAPPIDLWAESMAVSRFVDGVVLVLRAHVTRREIVRSVTTRLEDLNTPVLGVVLNDRTFPIPEAVYRLI